MRGEATLVGPKLRRSPSLRRYPERDDEVRALAVVIWGHLDGSSRTCRRCGRGWVARRQPLEEALAWRNVRPDSEGSRGLDTQLAGIHRTTLEAEIDFVAYLGDREESLQARFRVSGRRPEIWRADDGSRVAANYTMVETRTSTPLRFRRHEAVFVVFGAPARAGRFEAARESTRAGGEFDALGGAV